MEVEARGRGGKISLCAFCRVPTHTSDKEDRERTKKLIETDHAYAFYNFAGYYADGDGVPQDFAKANELYLKAGELGCAEGYCNLGCCYDQGMGAEMDRKKAKYYYELAAMNGNVNARYNLARLETQAGNHNRAMKHLIIASNAGDKDSLDAVKAGFMGGYVTKDEYANTMRSYQQQHDEMKSDERDKARAHRNSSM